VNQAQVLSDGDMIKLPTWEEAAEAAETASDEEAASTDGKVNINTADAAALMTLPGIGESKAKSILTYRQEHGDFSSGEELMNIPGIKEGVYSKIKDSITVR
jgi:competence protein ComEA